MDAIHNSCQSGAVEIQKINDKIGHFLDRHPTLYKIILVVCHIFRALAMFGLMMWAPISMLAIATVMTAGSYLYRVAIERFCCFRLTVPALAGAGAAWIAKLGLINFVSGAALSSIGMIFANALAFIPLLIYIAWIIYISHSDIEKRIREPQNQCPLTGCPDLEIGI